MSESEARDSWKAGIEMGNFRPRLLKAETARARMDALCEFIEFWLGPPCSSPGESEWASRERRLPMPLGRLYECAARWADREHPAQRGHFVRIFTYQDWLVAPDHLTYDENGKVIFLEENQQAWDCRTWPEGEDPPVRCYRELADKPGVVHRSEELVCESLSRFLTTFVLQELTIGSRRHLTDDGLSARFAVERDSAVPIWIDGPYVYGGDHNYNFYLWGRVLVADFDGDGSFTFATNHEEGVRFLTENQGPVNGIHMMVWRPWTLDIRPDGSARLRYRLWQTTESAEVPAGTFDFPDLLATLSPAGSDEGHPERNAAVWFLRAGQSVKGKHLRDGGLVKALFRHALERATGPREALERRFATDWPH
jgi:hypothetical protein